METGRNGYFLCKTRRDRDWEDEASHLVYTSYLAVNNALYHLLSPGKGETEVLDYVCLGIKMKCISERQRERESKFLNFCFIAVNWNISSYSQLWRFSTFKSTILARAFTLFHLICLSFELYTIKHFSEENAFSLCFVYNECVHTLYLLIAIIYIANENWCLSLSRLTLCTISLSIFAIKIKFNWKSATYRLFTALKQSNASLYL